MKSRIILFILALVVWLLLNWIPDLQHLVIGLLVAFFVAFLVGDIFIQRTDRLLDIKRYGWFLYYIPIFFWEYLKAGIDVAYRVCHPDLPIKQGIVKIKTTLASDIGLTFLANSVTLAPGMMCVDIDREKGLLYVHCIDVKDKDVDQATKAVVERFERILGRVFE